MAEIGRAIYFALAMLFPVMITGFVLWMLYRIASELGRIELRLRQIRDRLPPPEE